MFSSASFLFSENYLLYPIHDMNQIPVNDEHYPVESDDSNNEALHRFEQMRYEELESHVTEKQILLLEEAMPE